MERNTFNSNLGIAGLLRVLDSPSAKVGNRGRDTMMTTRGLSRRHFMSSTSLLTIGLLTPRFWMSAPLNAVDERPPLQEFDYSDVTLASQLHNQQLEENISVLMSLSEDSLLKPLRKMSGQHAPGDELGGWYLYDPNFNGRSLGPGFAPACTFGQWVSALARAYAINRNEKVRDKALRLNHLYTKTIPGDFYENNRFPAYCYDKLVCGLAAARCRSSSRGFVPRCA